MSEAGRDSAQRELLEIACTAAFAAGELLAERFSLGEERALGTKSSPTDLVSEADLDAERLISETIQARRPDDGLVGEEGGHSEGSSGLDWVVDPLDGTVNFLLGIPQWCVSVAVRDQDGPLAGVIFDPVRQETFTATRNGPALLDELPLAPPEHADLASAMVATGLAYGADVRAAQAQVLARLIPQVRDIRRFGSAALDLAWTAAGRYDAYFERSVKPWDVEAGRLICERAGLRVVELPAQDVLPWGVLAATPKLIEPLVEIVAQTA